MAPLHRIILVPITLIVGGMLWWSFVDFGPSAHQVNQAKKAANHHQKSIKNSHYVTLIDYSKPVFAPRLWVLDTRTGKVVLSAHVAHAYNSGIFYASDFSNTDGSKKSCTGAFVTRNDYVGTFGYSMRIAGLEGENDQALARAIVFHPFRRPWTWGCFGTLPATNKRLISLIKNGSLVYVTR